MSYTANIDLPSVAALLLEAPRLVITTHAKPDGDALGSVVALGEALRAAGKAVQSWLIPPVSANLRTVRGAQNTINFDDKLRLADDDLLVILDTGAYSQLGPMRRLIEAHLARALIVDHHLSGDVEAQYRYIDGTAAACSEIVAEIIDDLSARTSRDLFDPVVCDALFVGVASDTGWFRFSNTRPQTHELAARLLRKGVNHADLYARLEQTERHEKLFLLSRALQSIELLADGRVAVMVLRASDFAQTGALLEETERLIDFPQAVASVQLVILVTEPPVSGGEGRNRRAEDKIPGAIRLSFRSKPGPDAVNVADLAQRFGGGGHARAAGAKVAAPLEQVLAQVKAAAVEAVAASSS